MKLTTLIVLLGAVSASVLFVTMGLIIYIEFPRQQDRLLQQAGWTLAENLRRQIEPLILTDQGLPLSEAITGAKQSNKDIDYIFVLDKDNTPLASTFPSGVPKSLIDLVGQGRGERNVTIYYVGSESQLHMSTPLMEGELGSVHIGINRGPILAFTNASIVKLTIAFLVMTVAALATALLIGRGVGRPLNQIAIALHEASGRWPQIDHIDTGPTLEVREFAAMFRQMISQLKRADEERQEYEHKLYASERMASVGQLAAEVAHEINNPLDGLIDIARHLEQIGDEPEKLRRYLPLIKQGLEQMERVGRRLLTFSRTDVESRGEVFDVQKVVDDIVALTSGTMKKHGVVVEASSEPGLLAMGSAVATGQAVMNLLLNASDAMMDGGGKVKIEVSQHNGQVWITVTDQGPGISEKIGEQIFEPFFSTKRAGSSTGLGLTVSQNLIRKSGGDLVLAERQTQTAGATFVIRLVGHNAKGEGYGVQSQVADSR
ncbi:MAG: HAMP domain-containing histidine kinase [Phycisphaerales bacterium]|nr:MAG: HAMP domain-containing histidine kinase [Phycisphaerales bacterium]